MVVYAPLYLGEVVHGPVGLLGDCPKAETTAIVSHISGRLKDSEHASYGQQDVHLVPEIRELSIL